MHLEKNTRSGGDYISLVNFPLGKETNQEKKKFVARNKTILQFQMNAKDAAFKKLCGIRNSLNISQETKTEQKIGLGDSALCTTENIQTFEH